MKRRILTGTVLGVVAIGLVAWLLTGGTSRATVHFEAEFYPPKVGTQPTVQLRWFKEDPEKTSTDYWQVWRRGMKTGAGGRLVVEKLSGVDHDGLRKAGEAVQLSIRDTETGVLIEFGTGEGKKRYVSYPVGWAEQRIAAREERERSRVERDGVSYRLVRAKPEQVRVLWKDGSGAPLTTLKRVADHLRAAGEEPLAVMNGGIFEPGHVPSGLLVQDGVALTPINRRAGKGNFFLKPNAVFWIADGKAGVTDAAAFDPSMEGLSWAVQSGPMLLKGGKTHPVFKKDSKWRLHRNGVGVTRSGEVIFAITEFRQERFPTLYDFADLFRSLDCEDALFLDGDISQIRTTADFERPSNRFASMIGVVAEGEVE